jgi:hypothetical protein
LKTITAPYKNETIVIATLHGKEALIAPVFFETLGANVITCAVNTDSLGTFSGEIPRRGTALACARDKCAWGLTESGGLYGVASEGLFGPHPHAPFLGINTEILYFIDKKRDFELHVSTWSSHTNYRQHKVTHWEAMTEFAKAIKFPSHALLLKSGGDNPLIFKGLQDLAELKKAFDACQAHHQTPEVWVETDMRAHMNPSRQAVITDLARQLAKRLSEPCPDCHTPGFGVIRHEKGLPCEACSTPTDLILADILGCTRCDYQQTQSYLNSAALASPSHCPYCNP